MKLKNLIILCLISTFLLTGCGKTEPTTTSTTEPMTTSAVTEPTETTALEMIEFDARVYKISGDSMLLGDISDTLGYFFWAKHDGTAKEGDIYIVSYNGMVMESFPPQLGDMSIRFKEHGHTLLPMYEKAFIEIFEKDDGLNGGIEFIAADLTGETHLSELEKEGLRYMLNNYFYSKYNADVIMKTADDLAEEGLMVDSHIEKGLLFELETGDGDKKFEFDLSKYRSPLGAYGMKAYAKLTGNTWDYEVHLEWIS